MNVIEAINSCYHGLYLRMRLRKGPVRLCTSLEMTQLSNDVVSVGSMPTCG
jgi:hypothetical protein